jgi:hypothetical protein
MTSAAILLPLILASLSMMAAAHAELARPLRSPRLAARGFSRPASRLLLADPGAVVALNATECERLYSTPPIATCARGAARL